MVVIEEVDADTQINGPRSEAKIFFEPNPWNATPGVQVDGAAEIWKPETALMSILS